MTLFRDRRDAGAKLAVLLKEFHGSSNLLVLGLARGGIPVAYEIALALNAELDVFTVRKLGCPQHKELAFGAIATGGMQVINEDVLAMIQMPDELLRTVIKKAKAELAQREYAYRPDGRFPEIKDRRVIVVDDGVATGATIRCAIRALRQHQPAEIIAAIPVGARSSVDHLACEADRVVCLEVPAGFEAVGGYYNNFEQTTDQEVLSLLFAARRRES
jgi:putative phosphoribosyl transferase